MKYYNYTDLEIVSAKKPFNTHLFWEHSTYGLILVASGDQTKLYISTDKGDNWSEIDLSDNTNSFKIQAGWLDGNDLWLVMCDNDGIENEFEVCYIELDDSNDCNPIAVQATSAADAMFVYDIFKLGTDFYVYWNDDIGVGAKDWITEVTVAPFVAKDDINTDVGRTTHVVVVGTKAYWWKTLDGTNDAKTGLYDSIIPAITFPFNVINGYFVKTDTNFRAQSYDNVDLLYCVLEKNADNKNYLIDFSITGDSYNIGGEHNGILMLDRNTASGVMEKAFHLTEYKIYQLHPNISHQLNLISVPDTDAVFIGITDNFLMNNDGDMWEYEDVITKVLDFGFIHKIQESPFGIMQIPKNEFNLEENIFIRFLDNFTTAGSTSEEVILEGIIDYIDDLKIQTASIRSLAYKDLSNIFPSGDYPGRSDEIITSILSDNTSYITKGTFSSGSAMGNITFGGDLSLERILDGMAYFENWVWYLTPEGVLYFNDGTVDSLENFTGASIIYKILPSKIREVYNSIQVKGAYIDGVQMVSDWQIDQSSIDLIGENRFTVVIPFLNTVSLCNTAATNVLIRLGKVPIKVTFRHQTGTVGMIQPGQTITFEFSRGGIIIDSDQFIIQGIMYDLSSNGNYTILDELP